ncbi:MULTISPECIES: hypothetical protein [Idiomarina]|uniref:hypothetical protein n=1 Tax=Idiomarina TaxID=135575 RepID=UPI001F2BF911|nr:hypothetical protein [Idiomarina abyssalis]
MVAVSSQQALKRLQDIFFIINNENSLTLVLFEFLIDVTAVVLQKAQYLLFGHWLREQKALHRITVAST